MLSRLALRNVATKNLPPVTQGIQALTTSTDHRPVRLDKSGPVRLGFIPDEWFTFFYPKTGVTGPYTFGIGLATYLCSKEIYVMEHEYYTGLSILLMVTFAVKKFGPSVAAYCDREIEKQKTMYNGARDEEKQGYLDGIDHEKKEQWRSEAQQLILQAKKESVALQLEATYRERLANIYNEVKRRLDYQVQVQSVERRVAQKHMANWIISGVMKSITPDQEKATLQQCIADLQGLAARK